jgi:hypothetical protein
MGGTTSTLTECQTMMPPANASGQPVGLADSFDVPVIVRHSRPLSIERRPGVARIDRARSSWPTPGDIPPAGDYVVSTTWRDVVDAAMTVGRDPFAWLAAVPGLASAEIIARRSPLAAYLYRTANGSTLPGSTGYRLQPNVVYRNGTEKTARALFAYRIGMTMAEWACRGLMGLGPTIHAEAVSLLPGKGPNWSPENSQPDLVGFHQGPPGVWLVEAKGGRRVGKRELSKGAAQLSSIGLMSGPHMRVLCGTSIEHRVFMTIDVEVVDGTTQYGSSVGHPGPNPSNVDDQLLDLAQSRMLSFYALEALPRGSLSVRPVGPAVANRQASPIEDVELVVPLERDESTQVERVLARDTAAYTNRSPASKFDMLTGRVPGTDVVVGMSRRLYAACRNLSAEQAPLLPAVQEQFFPAADIGFSEPLEEETFERRQRLGRAELAERQAEVIDHLREAARLGYEQGQESTWPQLIDSQPQIITESPPNLLEGATSDSYIAIEAPVGANS